MEAKANRRPRHEGGGRNKAGPVGRGSYESNPLREYPVNQSRDSVASTVLDKSCYRRVWQAGENTNGEMTRANHTRDA